MFTGLVEEVGRVIAVHQHPGDQPGADQHTGVDGDVRHGSAVLAIGCDVVTKGAGIGESIAVNGVCLTVTTLTEEGFTADMMGETLARTALGDLQPGASVNLERAMTADGRLGGHIVQGHVDGVSTIRAVDAFPEWTSVTYDLPPGLAPYVVEKGSITIDGTSLTVAGVDDQTFTVGLIPHTMAVTTHGSRAVGDRVNLEVDVIAKYVARQLAPYLDRLVDGSSPADAPAPVQGPPR